MAVWSIQIGDKVEVVTLRGVYIHGYVRKMAQRMGDCWVVQTNKDVVFYIQNFETIKRIERFYDES